MKLLIDEMDNASRWKALAPDLATPSGEISLSDDKAAFKFGDDHTSGRIVGSTRAAGHVLRRDLAGLNLSEMDEIRLWGRSNRPAGTAADGSFFLEMKLASAAMGFDDPNNKWRRPLVFLQPGSWELIRLSIADLPPQVRGAVTGMQLKCINSDAAFTCNLDSCLAVREEMLADVEQELVARTHQKVTVDGTPVSASIFNPDAPAPALPYIRITPYDMQLAEQRSVTADLRMDYTETGFRIAPPRIGYDLYYDFDVYAASRSVKTQVFEYLLRVFAPRSELVVNGLPLSIELAPSAPSDYVVPQRVDRTVLRFKVQTWLAKAATGETAKRPFAKISIEGEPSLAGIGA